MTLERIEQHRETGLLQLAPALWGKPRIAALLTALLAQVQRLEDDAWDILELRTIDNADLVRLKVLGKLVGQPRLGFDTEEYRLLIRARARANRSQGRALDLRETIKILLGSAENFEMLEGGNATLYIVATTPLDATQVAMLRVILPDTRAAGVGLQLLFSDEDFDDVFVWGDSWSSAETWGSAEVM